MYKEVETGRTVYSEDLEKEIMMIFEELNIPYIEKAFKDYIEFLISERLIKEEEEEWGV